MSKKIKNIIIFLTISFFGISGIIETVETSHSYSSIIPPLWQVFFFFTCLWAIVYSLDFLIDRKGRKKSFHKFVWLLFFYACIIVTIGVRNTDCFKAEVQLYAHDNGDFGGISITLRKDKTYEVRLSDILGSEHFRGHYTMVADTLLLDDNVLLKGEPIISQKMFVNQNTIYQLDFNNQVGIQPAEFIIEN